MFDKINRYWQTNFCLIDNNNRRLTKKFVAGQWVFCHVGPKV